MTRLEHAVLDTQHDPAGAAVLDTQHDPAGATVLDTQHDPAGLHPAAVYSTPGWGEDPRVVVLCTCPKQ